MLHWVQVYQDIILAGKGVIAPSQGQGVNRAGEGIVRAGYEKATTKNKKNF